MPDAPDRDVPARDGPCAADASPRVGVLRVSTAGATGAGKSTLIGGLFAAPEAPAEGRGTAAPPDVSAREEAADGLLRPEYRFFSTPRRTFAVADAHGADTDVEGLVAGAAASDVALVVVDAVQGISLPVRRAALLMSSLGIRQLVLAVNKMDLCGWSESAFTKISDDFRALAAELGVPAPVAVPLGALSGDNVVDRSPAMSWYRGPALLTVLEDVILDEARLADQPLRLPVAWVTPTADLPGAGGTVVAGQVRVGDQVRVQPSGQVAHVGRIATQDGDLEQAVVGQAVVLTFDTKLELARGDLIVPSNAPADVADAFEATIVWTSEAPLLPGRTYSLRAGTRTVTASVVPLKYKINPANLQRLAAPTLIRAEVGVVNLKLDRPVAFDPHRVNRATGGLVLSDRLTGRIVGIGMLHFALRRAQNVHWQALDVNKSSRAELKGQRACVLWYTGLSGAGKSTIANLVDRKLHSVNRHTYLLDGDNVRHGLNKDLGFTDADRVENIRRIGEVAKLMVDAGLIVGTAFISPFRAERGMARSLLAEGEFIEVHVDTPLGVAEERDPKGLYKKARRGDLKNFTGIDSPYEAPENPEIRIDTTVMTPEQAAEFIVTYLRGRGMLGTA